MVRCLDRHTHSRLAGKIFHVFCVIFDNIMKVLYKIISHFGAPKNESLTLPLIRM
jgi:hypothetical protein